MVKLFGKSIDRKEALLCGIAATLFPTVIFFYFCAQNIAELSVLFTIAASLVVFAIAAVGYLLSLILFQRAFSALIFSVVCWLGCYLEPLLHSHLNSRFALFLSMLAGGHGRIVFITLAVLLIALVMALIARKVRNPLNIVILSIVVMVLVFLFNAVSIVRETTGGYSTNSSNTKFKTVFVADEGIASPNIYWIHADGMLSFDAVEEYYMDRQEDFAAALAEQGFLINRSANFEAGHSTQYAIPILTSPYAYDQWIKELVSTHENAMSRLWGHAILKDMDILRMNGETQRAFANRGYAVNVVGPYDYYYPPDGGYIWLTGSPVKRKILLYDKSQNGLLSLQTMIESISGVSGYFKYLLCDPLNEWLSTHIAYSDLSDYQTQMTDKQLREVLFENFDDEPYKQEFVEGLYDILHGSYRTPRLTFVHDLTPHYPFCHDENGRLVNSMGVAGYYPQHVWSSKVLLGMIDMILEVDPDAVIVIQSDHGLHGNTEADFKAAFGEDADAVELWNSTMSAIRVPEKYQTGEEHYAMENPLNISRYLVNSFVGRNYEYLPAS